MSRVQLCHFWVLNMFLVWVTDFIRWQPYHIIVYHYPQRKETLDLFLRMDHKYFWLTDCTEFFLFLFFFKIWFARVLIWINLKEKCINLKIRNEGGSKVAGALTSHWRTMALSLVHAHTHTCTRLYACIHITICVCMFMHMGEGWNPECHTC